MNGKGQMKSNWHHFFISLLFLASISLPLVFSDRVGGKLSEGENRYLASFPTFLTEDMKLAQGIKTQMENWLDDNIGFRTRMKSIQAYIDLKIFRISPSPSVAIGKSGWLFYTEDRNIEIGLGTYHLPEDKLLSLGENLEEFHQELAKNGIEFVLMLTPSKASIYPEFVRGDATTGVTLVDTVSDFLRNKTSFPVINTKPALLEAKKTEQVYYKTDTHWNSKGVYTGYRTVINSLNELGLLYTPVADISTYTDRRLSDLIDIMGAQSFYPLEKYEAIEINSPKAERVETGDFYNELSGLMQLYDPVPDFYLFRNNSVEEKTIILFGDSFTLNDFNRLLAENCSTLVYMYSYDYRSEILANIMELVKPDIFLMEVTERYISVLSE